MDDTIVFSDTFDVEEICNRVEQLFEDAYLQTISWREISCYLHKVPGEMMNSFALIIIKESC